MKSRAYSEGRRAEILAREAYEMLHLTSLSPGISESLKEQVVANLVKLADFANCRIDMQFQQMSTVEAAQDELKRVKRLDPLAIVLEEPEVQTLQTESSSSTGVNFDDQAASFFFPVDNAQESLAFFCVSKGNELLQEDLLDQAIVHWQSGLSFLNATKETRAALFASLGKAYSLKEEHSLAIKGYQSALDVHCDSDTLNSLWSFELANLYMNKGQFSEAIDTLKKATSLSGATPDTKVELLMLLGACFRAVHRLTEAKDVFHRAYTLSQQGGIDDLKAYSTSEIAQIVATEAYDAFLAASTLANISEITKNQLTANLNKLASFAN